MNAIAYIDQLDITHHLSNDEWIELLSCKDEEVAEYARSLAGKRTLEVFGKAIYTRGLIEFTNYCKNNCYYCGIRRGNDAVHRYRLSQEEILDCARQGYALGFRTYVLQGGEDPYYTDDRMIAIIRAIKEEHPDCAITLSLGERSFESYRLMFEAGADRYLLRHETADEAHYRRLHPSEMSFSNRMHCLQELHEIGYQVGCGFMVGSPYQTPETLAADFMFLEKFQPEMVGIGPFVPHQKTPFAAESGGTVADTLFCLSLIRLLLPKVLLPATTALGIIDPRGREKGILAGANVVMPNLSPTSVRKDYELYDNKICTGDEAAECRDCLQNRMISIDRTLVVDRGDAPGWTRN